MQTKHPNTETPETYTYCGITAPLSLWNAVGLETIHWAGGEIEFPRRRDTGARDGDLIEARLTSGSDSEAALVWLKAERRRQSEELERNRATERMAEATRKAGDDAIHAARIHRQAEELHCLANGVDGRRVEAKLR